MPKTCIFSGFQRFYIFGVTYISACSTIRNRQGCTYIRSRYFTLKNRAVLYIGACTTIRGNTAILYLLYFGLFWPIKFDTKSQNSTIFNKKPVNKKAFKAKILRVLFQNLKNWFTRNPSRLRGLFQNL